MKKLILLDVYNFMFRAYHAMPKTFTDKNGEPTNAVYGVTSMLINILDQIKPNYMVAAVDGPETTFRAEAFTSYKAHRKPMDTELETQIPKIFEIIDAFGIKRIQLRGYEADDIIATLTQQFQEQVEVVIISNDRDLWQLANGTVMIMLPNSKGGTEWLSSKEVEARFGFAPDKIADYKGLRGDTSDNIPGVHGIGEKTATSLIQQFGSIEDIYKNIERVAPVSLKEKLLNNYEQALMSKNLAKLIYDAPMTVTLDECKFTDFNRLEVKKVLERYNFKSLIRRLGFEPAPTTSAKKEVVNLKDQPSLF